MPPQILFLPENTTVVTTAEDSILKAAKGSKVDIRYGCGAGVCGLCGVRLPEHTATLSPMTRKEKDLLAAFSLPLDGTIRFACQTKVLEGSITVDLAFQDEYCPSDFSRVK